ncbi:hypothetical protein JVU11DRAFT_12968 [Chiua virens]|nr:hypothetical protein JVU11DRAFT_12968 [Chiua virens]
MSQFSAFQSTPLFIPSSFESQPYMGNQLGNPDIYLEATPITWAATQEPPVNLTFQLYRPPMLPHMDIKDNMPLLMPKSQARACRVKKWPEGAQGTPVPEVSGKPFRWSGKKYLLTYSQVGDVPFEEVGDFFGQLKTPKPQHWKAAEESHQDGGKHWHVLVTFVARVFSKNLKLFDIRGIHPNVRVLKYNSDVSSVWDYIHKEEGARHLGTWSGPEKVNMGKGTGA